MDIKRGLYVAACVLAGVAILTVSIAKATLDINAREDNEDKLRSVPINFMVDKKDGTSEAISYNLPVASMLPSNPLYGFKRVRDYLWMFFAKGSINKSKIMLLIADKKMAEAKALIDNSQTKMALESVQEALDQLKYAHNTIALEDIETGEVSQIKTKVYEAGLAYSEILKPIGQTFDLDTGKYEQLVNDLNKWNEEKRQENEANSY